ncbi:hypothetical protein PV328_005793 [Microctonus aethiopoides]|uniref:Uncharacterized protein n=1 Tax=Microctonus aethiopoides TaxID=144406 RepID=A0AA39KSV8_9HYME|nr:hypothetical protein PV328_005793 [Microctonus aethiopoides]
MYIHHFNYSIFCIVSEKSYFTSISPNDRKYGGSNNDTECLNSEKCIGKRCMDPCPGLCGIDAICKVIKHTMTCSCFKCYEGNPYIRCTPYLGLKRWMCKYFGI